MAQKPSLPKGTRDFSPQEVAKRTYIMNIIREQFTRFGFQPIETPSFENSSTLMGKYGEEGDRLIFKILNSGDYLTNSGVISFYYNTLRKYFKEDYFKTFFKTKNIDNCIAYKELGKTVSKFKISNEEKSEIKIRFLEFDSENRKLVDHNFKLQESEVISEVFSKYQDKILSSIYLFSGSFAVEPNNQLAWISHINRLPSILTETIFSKSLTSQISEKALRYDLTVPFARYVVQHQNDIVFPFKRYQIQPVWRADRPQKGRFREFYQCDADVVGSDSLWQEVEFVQLYDAVFTALQLDGVVVKMNNRKILSGIAEVIGASDKLIDFTVALDKLDKIGEEGVTNEMLAKGISQTAIEKVAPLFSLKGTFGEQLDMLKTLLANSETGRQGIDELQFINEAIENLGLQTAILQLDVTLARGLNYYTGAIFEVSAPKEVQMGSIGGGGRYADLTGIFGLKDVSGVGISFGLDRIYLVLEELDLFPKETTDGVKVFFVNFGKEEAAYAMKAISRLRAAGIPSELYPDAVTSNKQMKKQMTYANRRNIPYLVMAGTEEMEKELFTLKNMQAGTQKTLTLQNLIQEFEK